MSFRIARGDYLWASRGAYFTSAYQSFPLVLHFSHALKNLLMRSSPRCDLFLLKFNLTSTTCQQTQFKKVYQKSDSQNELTHIWRERNIVTRAFTFDKKQATNRTIAWVEYFLVSRNTSRYISSAHIGRENALSDHRPIFFTITPATLVLSRGLRKFDNALLKDANFVEGCNHIEWWLRLGGIPLGLAWGQAGS